MTLRGRRNDDTLRARRGARRYRASVTSCRRHTGGIPPGPPGAGRFFG